MKRILSLLLAWSLILGAPLSFGQVTVDGTKTGAAFSTSTWAGKAAATTVPAGTLLYATDVGEAGSFFQSNATRWRAQNGTATLKTLGAVVSGVANTETNVLQTLLPAGSWQTNDILRIWLDPTKSGTTDSLSLTVRVGTTGTTSDTALTGLSGFALLLATGLNGGSVIDVKLVSATSAVRLGQSGTGGLGTYSSPNSGNAATAATTITDASANALYVSVNIASSGATNTVGMQFAQIQLITP